MVAALLVPALFAVLARFLGMVSTGGALGGFVIAALIYVSLGPPGFAVLALFVVGGSLLTRLGYRVKKVRGIAEEGSGRRGAKNALANSAVAVLCALLAVLTPLRELFATAFVAALGAAFADTAESEVGQLYRRNPRLITGLRQVSPGTDGAVSVSGTLAGIGAAIVTALLGWWLGLMGGVGEVAVVAGAGFAGSVVDSFTGALAPRLGNELTNVLCTLSAAIVTLALLAQGW